MPADIHVLVISGSMGSGKTTILAEASDLLTAARIVHAAIDLDYIALGNLPATASEDLVRRNLVSLWNNYAAAGVTRLIVCEALDTEAKRRRIIEAVPSARVVVCRLRASLETMQQRVRRREPGILQRELVARVVELEESLNAGPTADFEVTNEGRSVTEVAREVLARAGWLAATIA